MVDSVADAGEGERDHENWVSRNGRKQKIGKSAKAKASDQNRARVEAIDGEAHRRLQHQRQDIEQRDRQTKLDITDMQLTLEQRKQRRQDEIIYVTGEMRGAYLGTDRIFGPLIAGGALAQICRLAGHAAV